jgi:uncharacterized protein YciI
MFVIVLRFAANRAAAPDHMAAHNAWIDQGFADGVFLMTGSLQPSAGGAVLAHNATDADIRARVAEDPFVREGVVYAEILEIKPGRSEERLRFLLG